MKNVMDNLEQKHWDMLPIKANDGDWKKYDAEDKRNSILNAQRALAAMGNYLLLHNNLLFQALVNVCNEMIQK